MKTCNICGEKLKKIENFDEVVFECPNTKITVEDDLLLTSRATRVLENLSIKNKCELLGSDINIFTHKTKREITNLKEEVKKEK